MVLAALIRQHTNLDHLKLVCHEMTEKETRESPPPLPPPPGLDISTCNLIGRRSRLSSDSYWLVSNYNIFSHFFK